MQFMNRVTETQNRPLVLVVDDDKLMQFQLRQVLEQDGYRVVGAVNGKDCLHLYPLLKPDIVLLDALMPVMDGFSCCFELQALADAHAAPILMITGLNDQASVDRAFASGAMDYVTKPIHWAVLRQRLRRLVQQFQLQQQQQLLNQQLEEANQILQRLALVDELTQVANRRWFDEYLTQVWNQLRQENQPLALILCDIDCFKIYNDTYGHLAGDRCLRQVADAIQSGVRHPTDLLARYGGEEFAIILPNTDMAAAAEVAHLIQLQVNAVQIAHVNSPVSNQVTLSLGATSVIPKADTPPTLLIAAADKALYHAKAAGRNRVMTQAIEEL